MSRLIQMRTPVHQSLLTTSRQFYWQRLWRRGNSALETTMSSAVARGRAGGPRPPPVFFLKSKNRPIWNVENKVLSGNCLGSFQKTTCLWSLRLPLRQLRQFNNYELTVMTLKGETFAGFKIQRLLVFYFVIDVASVILSIRIGLLRQCTK